MKRTIQIKNARTSMFVFAALVSMVCAIAMSWQGVSAKGGAGGAGDSYVYSVRYSQADCPLPAQIYANYETIAFCALGKRAGDTQGDYTLRVDGYTQLLPSVITYKVSAPITLPCGNLSNATKFNASSFTQTSPVPPPYRYFVEGVKIVDTCL
jgi:hypothetical protein